MHLLLVLLLFVGCGYAARAANCARHDNLVSACAWLRGRPVAPPADTVAVPDNIEQLIHDFTQSPLVTPTCAETAATLLCTYYMQECAQIGPAQQAFPPCPSLLREYRTKCSQNARRLWYDYEHIETLHYENCGCKMGRDDFVLMSECPSY